jgi:flagellar basal-body rod protein FlgC
MDSLVSSIKIAGSGMDAQSRRIQVVAENIANANSTAKVPGGDPYQRKIISFVEELDRKTGANLVKATDVARDTTPFSTEFDPSSPYADESGFVKLPNVNAIVEMADMREANRSYEANLQVIKQVRDLISMSVDLLRAT